MNTASGCPIWPAVSTNWQPANQPKGSPAISTFTPDVSYFQKPVDDTFNRDWLIFRACFGAGFTDPNAAHNLAWARKAKASGKIKGFSVYVVYLPGQNAGILAQLDKLGVPKDCVVEIDVETWRGQSYEIRGNHSADCNDLANKLRARQGGNADLVVRYGNKGDLAEVWPSCPDWLGAIVASYGGVKPTASYKIVGWQYTDGEPKYDRPGAPSATPPFGRCDHNELFALPGDTVAHVAAERAAAEAAARRERRRLTARIGSVRLSIRAARTKLARLIKRKRAIKV